jgi:hypothetical protein
MFFLLGETPEHNNSPEGCLHSLEIPMPVQCGDSGKLGTRRVSNVGSVIAEAYETSQWSGANLSISLDYPLSFVLAMNCGSR